MDRNRRMQPSQQDSIVMDGFESDLMQYLYVVVQGATKSAYELDQRIAVFTSTLAAVLPEQSSAEWHSYVNTVRESLRKMPQTPREDAVRTLDALLSHHYRFEEDAAAMEVLDSGVITPLDLQCLLASIMPTGRVDLATHCKDSWVPTALLSPQRLSVEVFASGQLPRWPAAGCAEWAQAWGELPMPPRNASSQAEPPQCAYTALDASVALPVSMA